MAGAPENYQGKLSRGVQTLGTSCRQANCKQSWYTTHTTNTTTNNNVPHPNLEWPIETRKHAGVCTSSSHARMRCSQGSSVLTNVCALHQCAPACKQLHQRPPTCRQMHQRAPTSGQLRLTLCHAMHVAPCSVFKLCAWHGRLRCAGLQAGRQQCTQPQQARKPWVQVPSATCNDGVDKHSAGTGHR